MLLKLMRSETIAPGVMSFLFEVKEWVDFKPGQFAIMKLDALGDDRRGVRSFSISSSPTEKGHLLFTTKISQSAFKQKLASMKIGEEADIRWAYGGFVLQEDYSKSAIMVIGGIGITPIRSMIKFATDKKLPLKITLLYSNKTPDEIVYFSELEQLQKENPNLKVIHTITRPEESKQKWDGRVGRIDEAMLREFSKPGAIYYNCGPPAMVQACKAMILSVGVKEEDIRCEEFTGY